MDKQFKISGKDLTIIKTDVAKTDNYVLSLKRQIAQIQAQVASFNAKISELEKEITDLKGAGADTDVVAIP